MNFYRFSTYFIALFIICTGANAGQCPDAGFLNKTISVHMVGKRDGKLSQEYRQERLPVQGDEVIYHIKGNIVTEEKTSINGLFDKQINIIEKESGKKSPWITYSYDIETKGLAEKISVEPTVVTRIAHGAFGSEQKFTAKLIKTERLRLPLKKKDKTIEQCDLDIQVIEFAYHDDQNLVVRYHYSPALKLVLKKEETYIKIFMGSMMSKKKKGNTPTNSVLVADYIIAD